MEDLAGDDEVDVVYVASPNDRHRDHALACLSAGRAVLCEKPFAVSADEARDVIDLARSSLRFCMEAMWMRFQPAVAPCPQDGSVRRTWPDPPPSRPTSVTLSSFDPENRFFDPRRGGESLLDRGVYLLSLAYFLLGSPAEVTGRASVGPSAVDEQESLLLTHQNGALSVLTASLRSRLRNEAVIVGTHGQIRIHDPFYAPRKVSWTRFVEPSGPLPIASSSATNWKSRIKRNRFLRRAFETIGRPVLESIRRDITTYAHHGHGHGYEYEAAEVVRCLGDGLLESPTMPMDETLAILNATDRLRQSWGLAGPREDS